MSLDLTIHHLLMGHTNLIFGQLSLCHENLLVLRSNFLLLGLEIKLIQKFTCKALQSSESFSCG